MKDYYGILEVNEKASQEIIEKAYKTLVKKYHPDLYSTIQKKEAEQKLKEINEAYDVLSNSFLRSQYDIELQKEKNNKQRNEKNIKNQEEVINQKSNPKVLKNRSKKSNVEKVHSKTNIGAVFELLKLEKDLCKKKLKKREKTKMNQKDWMALGLTIVIIVAIGVILWFIPFTNGWMRQLIFENALFNLIGGLFS